MMPGATVSSQGRAPTFAARLRTPAFQPTRLTWTHRSPARKSVFASASTAQKDRSAEVEKVGRVSVSEVGPRNQPCSEHRGTRSGYWDLTPFPLPTLQMETLVNQYFQRVLTRGDASTAQRILAPEVEHKDMVRDIGYRG